jgi:hypothetical protein
MTGERALKKLLISMSPVLLKEEFVFCSFLDSKYGDRAELEPFAACVEPEGLTLIIPRANADAHEINYESAFRAITLRVHSSLDAVGLTAAVATQLTEHGISANVIAGYFHDHIFVQSKHAEQAIAALGKFGR